MLVPPRASRRVDPAVGGVAILFRWGEEIGAEGVGLGREADEAEAIVGIEARQDLVERFLGLRDLVARHAAGGVDDEDHILGLDLARWDLHPRSQHQRKESVLVDAPVGEEEGAELAVGRPHDEAEIALEARIVGFEGEARLGLAVAPHVDGVARRVNGGDRARRLDGAVDHQRSEPPGERRDPERERVFVGSAGESQHLRVAQPHARLAVRRDREDRGLHAAEPGPLEEPRVALAPHDLLVDAARAILVEELALERLAVDPELELGDRGPLGNRPQIGAFRLCGERVAEDLLEVGRGGDLRDPNRGFQRFELEGAGDRGGVSCG